MPVRVTGASDQGVWGYPAQDNNWGYAIIDKQRPFAHLLIDDAGVESFTGTLRITPKALAIYKNKPIIYGCGDLLNDYEGISGCEAYRGDLGLMYLSTLDPTTGRLNSMEIVPIQVRRLSLYRALLRQVHN